MIPIRDNIPSKSLPWVNYTLIALNAVVFFFEILLMQQSERDLLHFVHTYGLVPEHYVNTSGQWQWRYLFSLEGITPWFSCMFLHGYPLHVIGNLLFLWIFGDNVEDRVGHGRYLIFYLMAGLAAGVVHVVSAPGSTVPTVGASGAIAGVLGAYFLFYPKARILILLPIFFWPVFFELPAIVFLAMWLYVQYLGGVAALAEPTNVGSAVRLHSQYCTISHITERWPAIRKTPARKIDGGIDARDRTKVSAGTPAILPGRHGRLAVLPRPYTTPAARPAVR